MPEASAFGERFLFFPWEEMAMAKINGLCVGESLVGEGNEVAHIDLIMGPRGSAAETAFANALTNQKDGFTSLLAVVAPNLLCKPATILFNKVIPQDEAENLFICAGVFIHWEAADDKKIQDYNYRATKEAIARAVNGEPKVAEVVAKRDQVKHPFAA
jgi:5,6,7,8-tetrahydromethanopterin hydro-lyase